MRRWTAALGGARKRDHSVAVLIAGLLALGFLVTLVLQRFTTPTPAPDTASIPESIPPEEEIRQLVERLGRARTVEDFLPLIRNPDNCSEMVKAWLSEAKYPLPMGGRLVSAAPARQSPGHTLITAHATFEGRPLVQLLFVQTSSGWRLDWRSFAQRGDMSLAEFRDQPSAKPVLLLAVVQRASRFTGPFADDQRWISLRLCDSMGGNELHAWVSRDNAAVLAALNDLPTAAGEGVDLARTGRRKALRVRSQSQTSPAAEVVSVEGDGWFIP